MAGKFVGFWYDGLYAVAFTEDGDIYIRHGTSHRDLEHPDKKDHWKRVGNVMEDCRESNSRTS
jgi:hypothetical protein